MIAAAIVARRDGDLAVFTPTGCFPWELPAHTIQSDHAIRVDGNVMREVRARDEETREELQHVLANLWESDAHVRWTRAHNGNPVKLYMFAT